MHPVILFQVCLNLAPAECHCFPQLVVGQNSPGHPVIHRSDGFIESPGNFGFANETLRHDRSQVGRCDLCLKIHGLNFCRCSGEPFAPAEVAEIANQGKKGG
jgi:hypothetical protein